MDSKNRPDDATVRKSNHTPGRRKKSGTALIKAGADDDLIVLGASKEGVFSSVLFGEIPEKIARCSHIPVMIVRRYEGTVKSIVKKVMG
jgi:hypothetical protein